MLCYCVTTRMEMEAFLDYFVRKLFLIKNNVSTYPALNGGDNGHSDLYRQDMTVDDKCNRPINFRVTWIYEHIEVRMTTALIREVVKHGNS